MNTIQWYVDKNVEKLIRYPQIQHAANYLIRNEVVAFPTETVYGLGANAESDAAVAKIFRAKGRPSDNPLIVHIANMSQLHQLVEGRSEKVELLMNAFWPGPLTIILQKKEGAVSELVTAGLDTVAIRMPDHPVALALLAAVNLPIAAPSANRSGKPSPTNATHVLQDLDGKIAGVVDGGPTGVGVESTVIDCTADIPIILRPGGISKEAIESIIGSVDIALSTVEKTEQPLSPGMKYTHYAPAAPLYLLDGSEYWIQEKINEERRQGLKVGVLASAESASFYDADVVLDCGSHTDLSTVARQLYDRLRAFDQTEVDVIFSEVFPRQGFGVAIMNRLEKAAGYRIIQEGDCR